ncbi:MAG: hypothetical protein AB2669_14540 [Candidatus Thiodiazotropha endolucinida]
MATYQIEIEDVDRSVTPEFNQAATGENDESKSNPTPFSLRLTFEERAILEEKAGGMPLGAYIRQVMLSENVAPRKTRTRFNIKDREDFAKLLSALGQSRLASNMNQLAKASNSGSLPVTPETEQFIVKACKEISWIRRFLVRATGLEDDLKP